MSPKVKGYTGIYVILSYTGTETHVSLGYLYQKFFGQGLNFFYLQKG